MILISNDFWNKIIMYNFDPYNVLLAIATNIPVLLMTDFVLQFLINFSENKTNILSQFCFSSRCILFQEHFNIFNGNKTKILNRAFTQLHNFDSVALGQTGSSGGETGSGRRSSGAAGREG